jgi:hypothetical protein
LKPNVLLSLIAAVLMISCAGSTQKIDFNMSLDQVERPKVATEQYGEVNTTVIDSLGEKYLNFEDELVSALFFFGQEQIGITIKNKTEHTMKISWDNAAWISPEGISSRVIHSGVRLVDRNSPQSPSVIVRNGLLSDIMIPTENIYYVSGKYGGWQYKGLIYTTPMLSMDMAAELAKAKVMSGKTCGVLLPIEIEGVQNDYIFTFKIGEAMIASRY